MSGGLPPGTTDADIDRAAPGYDDPPCAWAMEWETGFEICEYCGARWPWECDPEQKR